MSGLEETWRKSSYSGNAGNCVEVAVSWRKSSYSNDTGGECVEVAETPSAVLVRDISHLHLDRRDFISAEWTSLLANLKKGHWLSQLQ